ncbi:MAG: bifunctional molybdenum cofactor biosynthesis protein MoaC/MoaB, partial [Deltaproteobacteria bacterium]|nr:bifunctional molybdenum cofactor biosynthesis protein MoaC/MoaB [Deltaproteobacteria bacterium]
RQDKSGQIILEALKNYGIADPAYHVLPDEAEAILKKMHQCYKEKFDLVLTTGGTGLGPRDVTVEATQQFIDREVPGIMEAARSFGQRRTPYAMLSRGIAGLKGGMLVVNLPGSSRGTEETLAAIFPAILHGYKMMEGGGHGVNA